MDRILGLEIGTNDYVPKPFDPRELAARIRAVLGARRKTTTKVPRRETLTVDDLELSMLARSGNAAGQAVELTGAELDMLALLLRRAGAVVTREELAQAALGRPLSAFDRSVDVHVSRLRKKLGLQPCGRGTHPSGAWHWIFLRRDGQGRAALRSRIFWKILFLLDSADGDHAVSGLSGA